MNNFLTFIKILLFGLLLNYIDARLSSYDLKDIKTAWENPITKNILQEIRKFDLNKQSIEAIQTLENLNESFIKAENSLEKIESEIQLKCEKQKVEDQQIIDLINLQYQQKNVQVCSGQQIQHQMKQNQLQYRETINQNLKLISEIEEEIEELEAVMWYKLKQNSKTSTNLQQLIQIMLQITEQQYQSPQFKQLLSDFDTLQQSMAKDDPIRLMSEAFQRVLLQFDTQVIRKVIYILKNLQTNNKSEQNYLSQSKDIMLKNLNDQKELIQNASSNLESQISEIEGLLNNFQQLFDNNDIFGDRQDIKLQEKIRQQEQINDQNEYKCSKELQGYQMQVENNKRKMQFISTLIKFINIDSESMQKLLISLK
ncbi:hypothetical protein ABPG72_004585 [Tetrahymena utriculariae]